METNIKNWDVEDQQFWSENGSAISNRNLRASIPAMLLAFSVWIMWGGTCKVHERVWV